MSLVRSEAVAAPVYSLLLWLGCTGVWGAFPGSPVPSIFLFFLFLWHSLNCSPHAHGPLSIMGGDPTKEACPCGPGGHSCEHLWNSQVRKAFPPPSEAGVSHPGRAQPPWLCRPGQSLLPIPAGIAKDPRRAWDAPSQQECSRQVVSALAQLTCPGPILLQEKLWTRRGYRVGHCPLGDGALFVFSL